MVWSHLLIFCMVGTIVSWMVIYGIIHSKLNNFLTPAAEPHHTHSKRTSRAGGIGIIIGFIAVYILFNVLFQFVGEKEYPYEVIFWGALAIFTLGLVDDIRSVPARYKFLFQIIIAIITHEYGFRIDHIDIPFLELKLDLSGISIILTVLWFVSIMNLINLIDGLDGLAGGVGLMLMILLVILGMEKGISASIYLSIGMAGAIFGFLIHNFPPAKVYMGDSGAYTIGYVIAALSLMNFQKGAVIAALIGPMIALSLPIIDVLFAIMRRFMQGLPIFRPDKGHIHHQLIRSGFSHKNTVLILYGISLLALTGGVLVFSNQGRYFPLFLGFIMVAVIFVARISQNNPFQIKSIIFDSLESRNKIQNSVRLSRWFIEEADKCENGEALWNDYQFLLRKLGFAEVILQLGGVKKIFKGRDLEKSALLESLFFHFDSENKEDAIQFYAGKADMTERKFLLLSEIAFETWVLALKRWKSKNSMSFKFDAH